MKHNSNNKKVSEPDSTLAAVQADVSQNPVADKKKNDDKKPETGISWSKIFLRVAVYLLIGVIGIFVGGYGYVYQNVLSAVTRVDTPIVPDRSPEGTYPVIAPDEFDNVNVDEKEHFDGAEEQSIDDDFRDVIVPGDTSSSFSQGGHVPVFYDSEKYPIRQVKQVDPQIENILVFGIDAKSMKDHFRSDAMVVVTIDRRNGCIKLTSLMRDTAVNIEGLSKLDKLNHSYAYGGAGLLINTINDNFGLDIQKFAMFDFSSTTQIIDILGGIPIEVSSNEIKSMNQSILQQNGLLGRNESYITESGVQRLSGMQALAWARVRTDSDYLRAGRQRTVMETMIKMVMQESTVTQVALAKKCAGMFETNMTQSELLSLGLAGVQLGGTIVQNRYPEDEYIREQRTPVYMTFPDWDLQIPRIQEFIWGGIDID